jgi:hypothetical protein
MANENKPAKANKAAKESETENVFVAGYVTGEFGVGLILKNKVSKHAKLKIKATKTATVWTEKGTTMDELKELYPHGTLLEGAVWGDMVEGIENADGEEVKTIFEVEL